MKSVRRLKAVSAKSSPSQKCTSTKAARSAGVRKPAGTSGNGKDGIPFAETVAAVSAEAACPAEPPAAATGKPNPAADKPASARPPQADSPKERPAAQTAVQTVGHLLHIAHTTETEIITCPQRHIRAV